MRIKKKYLKSTSTSYGCGIPHPSKASSASECVKPLDWAAVVLFLLLAAYKHKSYWLQWGESSGFHESFIWFMKSNWSAPYSILLSDSCIVLSLLMKTAVSHDSSWVLGKKKVYFLSCRNLYCKKRLLCSCKWFHILTIFCH